MKNPLGTLPRGFFYVTDVGNVTQRFADMFVGLTQLEHRAKILRH